MVTLKVVPSRHQSACGVLVMRLPILIGHDVAHRYKKAALGGRTASIIVPAIAKGKLLC